LPFAAPARSVGDQDRRQGRGLLDEMIKGGSSAQVTKANEMRVKLA
jgi:hypothetical protein